MSRGPFFTASPGGGGGGASGSPIRVATFATPEASGLDNLLGTTSTTTGVATHNLTMPGDEPRNVTLTLSNSLGTFVGPFLVSGTINGSATSENLSVQLNGNITIKGAKLFDPGPLTLSRPAQGNANGAYTLGIGDKIGLPEEAAENAAQSNAGYCLFAIEAGAELRADLGAKGSIEGPSITGGYGAYASTADYSISGLPLAVVYIGVEE